MKIAFFHELHAGGARRSVNEFSKRLKKRHQVDLYLVDDKINSLEKKFFTHVYFFKFISKKWKGNDWKAKLYKDTLELVNLYYLHRSIAKIINQRKYDVVLLDPSKYTQAPFILRFLKAKKIYYCQEPLRMVYEKELAIEKNLSFFKYNYERANRLCRKIIDRNNIKYADLVIGNSRHTQHNIERVYKIRATHSYMGVDTNVFKPIKIKKDIDILFMGSYAPADGYLILEKAKKCLKSNVNIKVLAAEKQWITDDKQIRELYCRAKIAVALMHHEPFGLIPIEAMACGVPVVAVNEGGYMESVTDSKTGFLVARDPKKLAEKLNLLLSSKKLLNTISINARIDMVENWDWDKQVKKLQKYLE